MLSFIFSTSRSRSGTAQRGTSTRSIIAALWCVFESVITAAIVVSLPVPAVVGTAMNGGIARRTFRRPESARTVLPGRATSAAAALAASMGLPPPTARKLSQPDARYASRIFSQVSDVGLFSTSLKI